MALSLPGERSLTPASPVRTLVAVLARAVVRRRQHKALSSLLELDSARLRDLGVTRSDILEAMRVEKGRSAGMVLNAARARSARS